MMKASKSDGIELFGYAEHTHESIWVGSKGGMRLRYDSPVGRVEMTGKSHGRSRSTWSGVETHDFKDVSIERIDREIRQRLNWQERKVDLPAGRYTSIVPSGAVADLFTYMMWVSSGRDAFEGQSVFSKKGGGTRVGEKLSNKSLQLYSDPKDQQLPGSPFISAAVSSPFTSVFDNGQEAKRLIGLKMEFLPRSCKQELALN
jgi:Predicted Zn-dependent proteases and their inactivated homologs